MNQGSATGGAPTNNAGPRSSGPTKADDERLSLRPRLLNSRVYFRYIIISLYITCALVHVLSLCLCPPCSLSGTLGVRRNDPVVDERAERVPRASFPIRLADISCK
jgi:hypothetical protein